MNNHLYTIPYRTASVYKLNTMFDQGQYFTGFIPDYGNTCLMFKDCRGLDDFKGLRQVAFTKDDRLKVDELLDAGWRSVSVSFPYERIKIMTLVKENSNEGNS